MEWFVVLRRSCFKTSPRALKEISAIKKMNKNTWSYYAKDFDCNYSSMGYVKVFKQADAAERYFKEAKGVDGYQSFIYFILADTLTKKGAVKKALGCILFEAHKQGEIHESYHHDEDYVFDS